MKITLDYLKKHTFEKTGLEEKTETREMTSAMFAPEALSALPANDQEKQQQLNIEISDLIHDCCGTYDNLYVKTNINPETLRKYLNLRNKRKISREMLAKFVVGLQLKFEKANELFTLHSYPLDASNVLLDAVVVHCLEEHLDIYGFFDTCQQVGLNITPSE